MTHTPRALVLFGHGINCEEETAEAWRLAGAEARIAHVNDLVAGSLTLEGFDTLSLPGGFSFGDHLGSGLALARLLQHARPGGRSLVEQIRAFAAAGGFVLGICNGFQVLVKSGLLPDLDADGKPQVSLIHNDSGRFEDRWVRLSPAANVAPVSAGWGPLFLPVRHGEGKLLADDAVLVRLKQEARVLFRYADAEGRPTDAYPQNPNGSADAIAGLCDASGRILGLMPHPEAFLSAWQHPFWTRLESLPEAGDGLKIFSSIVSQLQS